jgi:hypothetical protein
MKRKFHPAAFLFALLIGIPAVCLATIQQQRAQIIVNITIFVTPNPLGYQPRQQSAPAPVVARFKVNPLERAQDYHAESLSFDLSHAVAASPNQGAIKTEAEISPNPNATLLYSNSTGVTFSQEAGTTVAYTCPYTVTVDTTQTNWTLDHGLYTNFLQSGGSNSFPGGDVANNTYIATPRPTATPFVVYSTDGAVWAQLGVNGGMKTYCVDLTITIPITTPGGTFTSNAVYTLLY